MFAVAITRRLMDDPVPQLKVGQPVKVVYTRGTERRETTLTPAARR
jgi:hypothetical protein